MAKDLGAEISVLVRPDVPGVGGSTQSARDDGRQFVEFRSVSGAAPEHLDLSTPVRAFWLGGLHVMGFAGLSVFVLAVLALHGLQANLNPVQHTISEYSLGRYGWLMRAAFLALAGGDTGHGGWPFALLRSV